MNIQNLLNKTIQAEKGLLKTRFMAPIVEGGKVQTRINGLVYQFDVIGDKSKEGWFILQPVDQFKASIVSEVGFVERSKYLSIFPIWRGILIQRIKDMSFTWLASPANLDDSSRRFGIKNPVPVYFVEGAQTFETVQTRFDGYNQWFEFIERGKYPAIANYLRKSLREKKQVEELHFPQLTLEDRNAYSFFSKRNKEFRKSLIQRKLEKALGHAQANLLSFVEHPKSYLVSWESDGEQFETVVQKNDLTVISSGICLDDGDRDFDLTSIVGVMKDEGNWDE